MDDMMYDYYLQGWQCPICKRVYAPFKDRCDFCGNKGNTVKSNIACEEWIDCDKHCSLCGGNMKWRRDIVLTSIPAQYMYKCQKCGNVEYDYGGQTVTYSGYDTDD